jgi:8-oxo-dGTP pyrophosphatase MutT (NUDIX family)
MNEINGIKVYDKYTTIVENRENKIPKLSVGIIVLFMGEKKTEMLLLQRKNTISYCDFLHGGYKTESELKRLLSTMTNKERTLLLIHSFTDLWFDNKYGNILKTIPIHETHTRSFIIKKNKFESNFNLIKKIIESIPTSSCELSWEPPKGRKNYSETSLDCAIRETSEESGGLVINQKNILKNISGVPIRLSTMYTGSDSEVYLLRYYIAILKSKWEAKRTITGLFGDTLSNEMRSYAWVTIEKAISILDPHKSKLISKVDKLLKIII